MINKSNNQESDTARKIYNIIGVALAVAAIVVAIVAGNAFLAAGIAAGMVFVIGLHYSAKRSGSKKGVSMKNRVVIFVVLGIIWGIVTILEFNENGILGTVDIVRIIGMIAIFIGAFRAWSQGKRL